MKTPREVLLGQHQAAEPKLDDIRQKVLAGLLPDTLASATRIQPVKPKRPVAPEAGWRELLWSLRWHFAGLTVAWLVVAALSIGSPPAPTYGVAGRDAASQKQLLALLRENQRQLREVVGPPTAEPAARPQKPPPSPRSQLQQSSAAAA
jgi:hypothetical protein